MSLRLLASGLGGDVKAGGDRRIGIFLCEQDDSFLDRYALRAFVPSFLFFQYHFLLTPCRRLK
nr:hypothetical protein [Candidatus Sigynarchaeota archaeon]